jgi:hypothetical protein
MKVNTKVDSSLKSVEFLNGKLKITPNNAVTISFLDGYLESTVNGGHT